MPEQVTQGIRVHVASQYVPERSDEERSYFFFSYTVTLRNEGDEPATLESRHWIITDGNGARQDVRGPGVVGAQPRLAPGEAFRYQSFCPLRTPVGVMEGTYQMLRPSGERFDAVIPMFSLACPIHVA